MEFPASTLPALGTLAVLHILAAATPGPNLVVVGHRAAAVSRTSGLLAVAGVALATLFWVVLSLAGIGVLLQQAGELYHWLRLIGAGYLLYAGGRYLLAAARPAAQEPLAAVPRRGSPFRAGLLTTLSNPKSGIFWTSVFALAVPPAAPAAFYAVAVAMVMAQTTLWYGLAALIFASAPSRRVYARLARWLEAIAGTALLTFGLRLAVEAAEPSR